MESLREIVKQNLEELRSREDAIYFQGTIKALEKIESNLNECIRLISEFRKNRVKRMVNDSLGFNTIDESKNQTTAVALSKKVLPFGNVTADGNRRAPGKTALLLHKAPDMER